MPVRRGTAVGVALLVAVACHHERNDAKKRAPVQAREPACASDADCNSIGPCVDDRCEDGRCVASAKPAGAVCGKGTACEGVARCDGRGSCQPGPPPAIDDGNACTIDACDPDKGVTHTPVDVDDHDACTTDACDPRTGVTHVPVDIDDGDDCTFDSCDPEAGVSHKKPEAIYTCDASCGEGYHAASRRPGAQCSARGALQTFCAPSCGESFYLCGSSCPERYHAGSRTMSAQCGSEPSLYTFCRKNDPGGFYTCDSNCPKGYQRMGDTPTSHCGPETPAMIRCAGAS